MPINIRTPVTASPEQSSSHTPFFCWKVFNRVQRVTPKPKTSVATAEYRPGKVNLMQKTRDRFFKMWNGNDLPKRSKYASNRRSLPPIDFRKMLHHHLKSIPKIPMASNHTHPNAASLRTSVAVELEKIVINAGFRPYSVSMSKRDQYDGCRYYFMDKDLDKAFRDDRVTEEHVLLMIDVDYYCDINQYLQLGNPIMIYTFVPTEAGGRALDASYTINNNVVSYCVKGGATYHHELWDYQGDNVVVKDKHGNTLVYVIEQHIIEEDPNRRVIGFYPIASYPKHTCPFKPESYGFGRLRPSSMGVNCIRNVTDDIISVAVQDSANAVTIPQSIYDALVVRRGESKNPVIADVERILNAEHIEHSAIKAPVLFKLLQSSTTSCGVITSSATIGQAKNFQTLFPLATEDGKPVGRAVAPSLVTDPAFVPCKSFNNDNATIQGRVNKVRNNNQSPPAWKTYDAELVKFIVPHNKNATGVPFDYERVIELQNKPAQRGRSEQAKATVSNDYVNKVKAFIKAEAYASVTDPRNISTVDVSHQLSYSRFTLPFKIDCLKDQKWFASSMTPKEISDRVMEICQYPHGIIVSDYSRLDGHVSAADKAFKEAVYQSWCAHAYRAELSKILAADRNPKGVTAQGLKYDPGYSQLSGSPGTTNDNNLVTLRHDYIALRELGNTPKQAWQLVQQWVLGASDDRIRANIPGLAQKLEEVATKLGHQLKSIILEPLAGCPVPFLGRIYASPATHNDSVQDPERTLAKLHLTMSPPTITPLQALYNRAYGYYVTDCKTPIIGTWCRRVIEILETQGMELRQATGEEDYRIKSGPYPQENEELLRNLMCQLLDLTADELDSIERAINSATTVEDLPEAILDNGHTIRHKINAAVGHDILGPVPSVSSETSEPKVEEEPKCPSVPIISETSASPEMIGSDASNPISASPSPPPATATNISHPTAGTRKPSINKQSSRQLKQSSPRSQQTKHQSVNLTPRTHHTFNECTRKDACRYHRNGATKPKQTTAPRK
ncbi:hypothetical protein 1 [Sanxia water strider virus 17]|uniref:hypothetical protein 1 n=1 Tax=Sanxia water strider virus 17 TaxID=1923401 RepID=UPI00090B38A3|nr:hypothetical protein 1 [Sanxia water strider virus 17]APG76416.1 hypothetical protein 1 [Sanxia water strider virus 17]